MTADARPDRAPVDLHMHSTASDGSLPPEAVVQAAHAAGLGVIALTDHDTMGGVDAARREGDRIGVRVITGTELSAHDGDREVHLLALHLSRVEAIESHLAHFRETRRTRAERIVAALNGLGIPVTFEAVLAQSQGGAVGRPHVARALIAGGWAADSREAFDRYLGHGRPANVPKPRLPIADAIRLVHDAGGLAILAHPGPEGNRQRVQRFAAAGLDGLEVRHPSHSPDDTARLSALVEELNLVPSGGSDWHGAPDGPRCIGCMRVPAEWLDRQEARLASRSEPAHVT